MTQKEDVIEYYNKQIEDLDNEFQTFKESQTEIGGNQSQIFQRVGENMLAERKYQEQRDNLVRLRDDIVGVSPAIEAFLDKTKKPLEFSKFDVDSGKAKIDTSMNPLGGKEV